MSHGWIRLRPPPRTAASAALAAALIVVALVGTACGDDDGAAAVGSTGATATAPSLESRTAVVTAYLSALQAGDVDAARALATDRFAEEIDAEEGSWYHLDVQFSNISLGDLEKASWSATASRFAKAVYVPARFDLTQSDPFSLPNGPTDWGFLLGRNSDTEPWKIDGEGHS